jgi:hypothetical protein
MLLFVLLLTGTGAPEDRPGVPPLSPVENFTDRPIADPANSPGKKSRTIPKLEDRWYQGHNSHCGSTFAQIFCIVIKVGDSAGGKATRLLSRTRITLNDLMTLITSKVPFSRIAPAGNYFYLFFIIIIAMISCPAQSWRTTRIWLHSASTYDVI